MAESERTGDGGAAPALAVLFDVDGVPIDTADAHGRVWRAWARERGLDHEAVWAPTRGRRRADILRMVRRSATRWRNTGPWTG